MKILYIHQYFKTPNEPGGTRSFWIAKEFVKRGHNVTIITSAPNLETDLNICNIDGIEVIYIKENYNQEMTIFRRFIAFLNFMVKSTFIAFKQKDIDLVFATSTPLTVGFPALVLKIFKKIPFVFEVRDLWPEVPIQMGALNNRLVKKTAISFEKIIYKNALHIIALSPGMVEGIVQYVPSSKVSMIPNMSKIEEFWPRKKDLNLKGKLGLKLNTFKVIHFGSLGIANGAEYIIEAAKLLNDNFSIEFLFVGGGSTENMLKKMCENYRLKNVKFLGQFPMKETSEIVNFSDVSIVSFKDIPILNTNSPNKLFDSLSAGKPIIVNSNGWTKDMVEEKGCGYYVNPNNPQDLVDRILFLKKNPEVVMKMGEKSRELAEKEYDKSILCNKVLEIIKRVYNQTI